MNGGSLGFRAIELQFSWCLSSLFCQLNCLAGCVSHGFEEGRLKILDVGGGGPLTQHLKYTALRNLNAIAS